QERGIPTVVWMTPILPYINDTEENITAILNECVRTNVKGIISFGMGLTLREGDREYYYAALDKHFPGMKDKYIKRYGNAYELASPNAKELMKIFKSICKDNGIMSDLNECFGFMQDLPDKYSQMSLFDQ
ncbi:MAG: M13 family metallopeptidase, partial [Lachnospiraceae bacterium]|nr:M13 family metallopeptidase [Lachnospiraceae bacterium]